MKRKIYLILSTLIPIVTFIIPAIFVNSSNNVDKFLSVILIGLLTYIFYSLSTAIYWLIINFKDHRVEDPLFIILAPFGLFTLRFKKIYYSDLGYFWIVRNNRKIIIYKQSSILSMIKIGYVFSKEYDSIENIKILIKNELEDIYEDELKVKRSKNNWESWDGCIDKKSERDNKLNEILK